MTDSNRQSNLIDASPTKDLFITMLVKDIDLIDAIVDLVDNCVDGARRIRRNNNYEDLWVRVAVAESHFTIDDNCGGIPVDVARRYAFKFGRPEGAEPTPHSVGRFGIGMKRALFKLGRRFSIESTTRSSHFTMKVDVEQWKRDEHNWKFEFETWDDQNEYPPQRWGTKITVEHLYEGVASEFRLDNFENRLAAELEAAHQDSIEKALAISLNAVPLRYRPAELLQSDQLQPAYWEDTFGNSGSPVSVKLYAGIADSKPSDAGWYVFCNGRLILEADRSDHTGWGESDGTRIPHYHNEFSRFRGYAYFDSDDPTLLPWNTTKTDVDINSSVYRSVRQKMMTLTRPVLDFLYKLNDEEKEEVDESPLATAVDSAKPVKLSNTRKSEIFVRPKPEDVMKRAPTSLIRYSKPRDDVERVKNALGVDTLKEVGERTFDYYFDIECED